MKRKKIVTVLYVQCQNSSSRNLNQEIFILLFANLAFNLLLYF